MLPEMNRGQGAHTMKVVSVNLSAFQIQGRVADYVSSFWLLIRP